MSVALTSFAVFAASQVGTPGPANMILLATGARYGLRRALPFVGGVALGKQLIIWPVGFGLLSMASQFPLLFAVLKWAALAYILYLAWRIMGVRLSTEAAVGPAPGFAAGLIVHPLNPKAWAMIITGFTNFVSEGTPVLQATATIAICLLAVQLVLHPLWAFAGQFIARSLAGKPAERYLMVTLAALTVASVAYAVFAGGKS